MLLNKNIFFKALIICLVFVSFFLGYFLRENAVGGGKEFYLISWPIIQSFREDFLFTIQNYTTLDLGGHEDYQLPFSHMINAYLNPFSDNIVHFQLSTTIISFTIFFIFAFVLKKAFLNINIFDILLTSSVILLLPFFRTSAFWGKNENYGWLFFILALYFFSEIKKNIYKDPGNRDKLIIISFCFTSACALYARQLLFFLPISYLLYLFINNANKKIILTSIISFSILAIPGLLVILSWMDIFKTVNLLNPGIFSWAIGPSNILKNIPILLSFFGFYFLPILIIELLNSGFKDFYSKYYKSFFFALVIFIFLSQTNLLNYLGDHKIGGGAILKVNYLIQKNNFHLFFVFSSLGFSILIGLFKENAKNNLVILIPMIIVYCFPTLMFQEYHEPLILLMFFLTLKTNLQKIYFKNISLSNFIFLSYFTIYLAGSIYFKHFAFPSYEKWLIFLNAM